MKQVVIRCDHCNKNIGGKYRPLYIKMYSSDLELELELCDKCAQEFKDYITNWIQPKHYKY